MKQFVFCLIFLMTLISNAQNSPPELDVLIESGQAKIELGDFEGAIKVLSDALKLDSESLKANYYRGLAKYRKGDDKGAIIDLTNSIKISPNNSGLYNQRGIARFNVKNYLGAIDDQNKAIELSPENINAIYSRGKAKHFLGALEEAMLDYNIAIANSEKNIYHCRYCENYKYFSRIRLPYSCKLFFQELQSMGIIIKIQTDKFIGNK